MLRYDHPDRNRILAAFLGADENETSTEDWILAAEANALAHEGEFPYDDYLYDLNNLQGRYAWDFIRDTDWTADEDDCDCDDDADEDSDEEY